MLVRRPSEGRVDHRVYDSPHFLSDERRGLLNEELEGKRAF